MDRRKEQPKKQGKKKRFVFLWVFGALVLLAAAVLIHYRGVRLTVTKEFGRSVGPEDFTEREATLEGVGEKPACGRYALNLKIGGVPTLVFLNVVDTVAPTAEPVDRTVPLGTSPGPDTFIQHVRDADVVRVSFAQTPDFNREWDGTIEIVLEDGSGNRNTVPVQVSVRAVVSSLTVEAGGEPVDLTQFLIPGVDAEIETPITAEMMRHVGTYPIRFFTASGVSVESELIVVDTVAPQAKSVGMLQIAPEETAQPEDFLRDVFDETDLTCSFRQAPDYDDRTVQSVTVRLIDEGGNTLDVESTLFITGIQPRVIEARREALTKEDFDNRQGQSITMGTFIPDTPGSYALDVRVNGVEETFVITVVDTTPPTIFEKPTEETLYAKYGYQPEDFFEAEDVSPVTMTFTDDTDLNTAGEKEITVLARDAYGNESKRSRTVTILEDSNPPRLYGVINRICYVGEPIAYLSEAFAEDDEDGRVSVTIETEVNLYEEGTYTVVYRAADRSGNVTEQSCTYTLIQRTVTEEELHTLMQSILDEITTPDMVDAEKLRAIFYYVKGRIKYANGVNHNYTDWRKAAYDGYTQGTGDCYNIYSLTRALLDETGIRYLSVERLKAGVWRTRHYWVLVNLGTGWYVFDPTWTPRHRYECFMWTKAQCNSCKLYWNFKESEYPPLATERFNYEAVVEMERNGLLP